MSSVEGPRRRDRARLGSKSPYGPDPRRVQICEAVIAVAAEHGDRAGSLTEVVERAGVTVADFERYFSDTRQAVEQVWEEMSDAFILGLKRVSDPPGPWLERIRAAAEYTLAYFEADAARSTFFILSTLTAGGEVAQARRDLVVGSAIDLVDEGRNEPDAPAFLSRATAEGVAGALYEAIVKAVGKGDPTVGRRLLPELMYITVLPYLGPEVAERQMHLAGAGDR
jgi:AcrR family transcriptional regulator